MSTFIKPTLLALAAAICTQFTAQACAEESRIEAGEAVTRPAANPLGGRIVGAGALALQRGGSDAASIVDLKLTGSVTGNSATNVNTGSNIITDGAFAGASGVPVVIQNSGNNVLIQSATIINVTVK
jgi:hypothetical protein